MNLDLLSDLTLPSIPDSGLPRKKLLVHFSGDDYILRIDNTSLESFAACDRAAFYRLLLGRTTQNSAAIAYGQAIHSALEILYRDGLDFKQMLKAGFQELSKHPTSDGEWRNPEAFEKAIRAYVKHYKLDSDPDFFQLHTFDGAPAVELRFADELGQFTLDSSLPFSRGLLVQEFDDNDNDPLFISKLYIEWTGVMDLLVSQNGQNWIVDHKTTSIEGPSYYDGFELSQQFIGYARAAQKLLGQPVEGALLNAIIGRKPTKTGKSLDFARRFYRYPTYLHDEWQHDVLNLIDDFVHRLKEAYFPKRTLWCVNKFSTCPYLSVCKLPAGQREVLLQTSNYSNYTWDPTKK